MKLETLDNARDMYIQIESLRAENIKLKKFIEGKPSRMEGSEIKIGIPGCYDEVIKLSKEEMNVTVSNRIKNNEDKIEHLIKQIESL